MNSNSKNLIASVAALQILLYHCWIPVFARGTLLGSIEAFLLAATYVGVDIFFFLSGYSLASRPPEDMRSFLKNRAVKILPLFFIAWLVGPFLWFLPSIMVVYLLFPPLYRICRKRPALAFALLMAGWAGLTCFLLGVVFPGSDLGIFLFRIPIVIVGAYAAGRQVTLNDRQKLIAGVLLLAFGTVLIYRFGYINRLNVPFRGTFYLTAIPSAIGMILLTDMVTAGWNSRLVERFGSMTLEIYAVQVVCGSFLVREFFRMTDSRWMTNLLMITAVVLISLIIKYVNKKLVSALS